MKTFKANMRMSNGRVIEVRVQAKSLMDAKDLLETQYGKGSIFTGPFEVR